MFLLSLLINKDSYNTQIIQCVNDTILKKLFRVPGFGTGSGALEPVPWNRFLRQITNQQQQQAGSTNHQLQSQTQQQIQAGQRRGRGHLMLTGKCGSRDQRFVAAKRSSKSHILHR